MQVDGSAVEEAVEDGGGNNLSPPKSSANTGSPRLVVTMVAERFS